MTKKKLIVRVSWVGLVLFLAIYFYQHFCSLCFNLDIFTPHKIKNFIQNFGPWAVFVYIVLYTINTITLLPPIGIMSLSAGAILGPLYGTIAVMAGSFLGTSATFFFRES